MSNDNVTPLIVKRKFENSNAIFKKKITLHYIYNANYYLIFTKRTLYKNNVSSFSNV